MGFISCYITPLVINSLWCGHTHTQARISTIRTGSILRNQVHTGHRPRSPGLKQHATVTKSLLWTSCYCNECITVTIAIIANSLFVTGCWKTYQIVTLGLFHFIGPSNGYTCTLHMHNAITRLSGLVCFSTASFADPVNLWLRQLDLWGALDGRHGSKIHLSDGDTSLTP